MSLSKCGANISCANIVVSGGGAGGPSIFPPASEVVYLVAEDETPLVAENDTPLIGESLALVINEDNHAPSLTAVTPAVLTKGSVKKYAPAINKPATTLKRFEGTLEKTTVAPPVADQRYEGKAKLKKATPPTLASLYK